MVHEHNWTAKFDVESFSTKFAFTEMFFYKSIDGSGKG